MKYLLLAELYQKLESTTKRLEKTKYLSEFLKGTPDSENLAYLIQGKIFPDWDARKIGVAIKLVIKALAKATGNSVHTIEELWQKRGDIGEVAEQLTNFRKQATLFSEELTVAKVRKNLEKLSEMEGSGTVEKKLQLIAELLTSAEPLEAKYIVRTLLSEMRTGLGEGVMRDGIVWACFGDRLQLEYDSTKNALVFPDKDRSVYDALVKKAQRAINLTNDYILVTKTCKEEGEAGLDGIHPTPGKPVKCMLGPKANDFEDALKRVGSPAACEFKFDGFRLQVHKKKDGTVLLFTRGLEEVSTPFPEVVELVKKHIKGDEFIFDSEAVGVNVKTRQYLAFQDISQRIKRKYNIGELAKKLPVELNMFDVLYFEGKSFLPLPFTERRAFLEKIIPSADMIKLTEQLVTSDVQKIEQYYNKALAAGNEGLMLKSVTSPYKAGLRVGQWVKIKPTMETLDLVIVGGEYGDGKRSDWIASFVLACRDHVTGKFLELGRMGTGLKEKKEEGFSFGQLTELLEPLITNKKGKHVDVTPGIVIEVKYEEIQKSPSYSSGFALRFPRFIRLRADKGVRDVSDLNLVKQLFEGQRGR